MSYAQLQADIADWLLRDDLAAVIPTFIKHGESRINKRIRHRAMESTQQLTFSTEDFEESAVFIPAGSATLPTDFLEARSLLVLQDGSQVPLEHVVPDSAEWLFKYRPSYPQYYSIDASRVVTRPAYTGEGLLTYYASITELSDTNTTNWLLTRFPEVYLYGSLIEGAVYLRDPALQASFTELFDNAAQAVLLDGRLARASRAEPPIPAAESRDQMRAR